MIAGRHGDRSDAGAGRYDVAGKQTTGVPAELIRNPRQCDKRVSENIGAAAAGNAFTVSIAVSLVSCEVNRAPVGHGRLAQDKPARAGIVCNQLRGTDEGVVLVAGIRDFDRRMECVDGGENFGRRVRLVSLLQVPSKTERELRLRDTHEIAAKGNRGSLFQDTIFQEAAGERTIHTDMRLPRLASRRNFPASETLAGKFRESGLNGVTFRSIRRPARLRQFRNS
jgi:hypothetical protein